MKLTGPPLRILKYLYPRPKDDIFGTIGELKRGIYVPYYPTKKGFNADNDFKMLSELGYVDIDGERISISDKGKIELSKYLKEETDTILNDIFISYDFAMLKYLHKRAELVQSNDFPTILEKFAPTKENNTEHGNLIGALNNLRPYINNRNEWYEINEFGEQYLKTLIAKQKNTEYKERIEIEQIESVNNTNKSVRRTNTLTLIIGGVSTLAIAVSAYFASQTISSKELQETNTQLQNNTKVLDSMLQSQKGIDSSLQKVVKNVFYAPLPRHK